jgi:hypothetical protein
MQSRSSQALVIGVVAAVGLALGGCSDGDESGGDVDVGVSFPDALPDTGGEVSERVDFVELCDGYARACCKLQICFNPEQDALAQGCVEAVRERCDDGLFGPVNTHVTPGAVTYSADAAGACLTPFLQASCDGLSAVTGSPAIACGEVFVGTKKVGEGCDFDQMCEGELFCKPASDGTCPGTCAVRAAVGEPCNGLRQLCADGSTCTGFGDRDGSCVVSEVARDGACELGLQCPDGQFCDTGVGRCLDFLTKGQACPGFGCQAGLICIGGESDKTCQDFPKLGEACEFTCAAGLECDLQDKVCITAPTKAGDACIRSAFPCGRQSGLQCRNSDRTCVGALALGEACGGDTGLSRCDFGWCDGDFQTVGECRPWRAFGDACEAFDGSCGPFECFQGKCALRGGPCRGPRLDQW